EHGRGLRVLLIEIPPSGIALLQPQYEGLVRAAWAHQAARNIDLDRLPSPLTMEGEKAAKKLPGVAKMLAALEKSGATSAAAILGRARSQLWEGLNSFVHCGIHPFQRGESGYPIPLLADLLKNSNGISMLTLVVLAEIANDASVAGFMRQLHVEFGDVLPSLEPLPT